VLGVVAVDEGVVGRLCACYSTLDNNAGIQLQKIERRTHVETYTNRFIGWGSGVAHDQPLYIAY
jgi:hypothetical protein